MLAGHDSTAMSLSWLLYDLARHPEDQKRVREEVARVKAQSVTPDCLGIADFDGMTYTNAVIRVRVLLGADCSFISVQGELIVVVYLFTVIRKRCDCTLSRSCFQGWPQQMT